MSDHSSETEPDAIYRVLCEHGIQDSALAQSIYTALIERRFELDYAALCRRRALGL